jgi:hypothetical protein
LIAVVATAIFAAALLGACGDSDSASSSSTSTSTATTTTQGAQGGQNSSKDSPSDGSQANKGGDSNNSGSAAVATPLKVSGGGSEQFRVKGGDNSIQEYGDETDESELQQAAEAVHGFYVARAEGDWATACTFLAKSMVAQLQQLAGQSPQLKSKGCAAVLKAFTRPLPASAWRETTVVDAGSLRREDERGFLIYYGAEKTAYAMPLEDEDGAWKLTLLAATPLG